MKSIFWLGLFGIVGMGVSGVGLAAPDGAAAPLQVAAADTAQASAVSAVGVVQQVKPEQGKVKINHEAIPALGWPPMTMYFRVKDKAVLEGIAAGDKVRFDLEKDATGLVITRMEKAGK
jgi:Cu(I)/Ag(I) efflux system protein CusF